MEYEVRFYYPSDMYDDLVDKLSNISDLQKGYRTYEKTMQFNHCDARYNFYSKEIDGRFRFRISSNDERNYLQLLIVWLIKKRKLKFIFYMRKWIAFYIL